jgi:hypothetical protein
MKKSEILRNEASVMLAGALESINPAQDFDYAETADKITKKMLEASQEYMLENTEELLQRFYKLNPGIQHNVKI